MKKTLKRSLISLSIPIVLFGFDLDLAKADQPAFSNYCKDSANQNNLPDGFCWVGQQLFNTNPSPVPTTIPTAGALTNMQLLVHRHGAVDGNGGSGQVLGASVFYLKQSAFYCYLPGSDETIPYDGEWHVATFELANATDGNGGGHTSNCDINFTSGDKLAYINLNTYAWDFAWTDNNVYTDGTSQQNFGVTNFGISPNHSLWFTVNSTPVLPTGNPPTILFSNDVGTGGFAVSTVSETSLNEGVFEGNVRIQNYIRLWMGVTTVATGPAIPLVVPNLGAGAEGLAATFSLIPPCGSGFSIHPPFVSCMSPGAADWTVGFASAGTMEFDLQLTTRSAAASITDILIGQFLGPVSPTTVIGISDQLYSAVPAFKTLVDCAVAPGGLTNLNNLSCAGSSLLTLARTPQQRQAMLNILANAGVNVGLSALVNALLGGTGSLVQAFGDLIALDVQTIPLGHPGVEFITLTAQ